MQENTDKKKTPYLDTFHAVSKPETYSEPCQTFTMECFAKIVNSYNYLRKISFSCPPLYETSSIHANLYSKCISKLDLVVMYRAP